MAKLTREDAFQRMNDCGINTTRDFHTLHSEQVERLLVWAARDGYRQPKNANGSKARSYHARLLRAATRKDGD